ncbi:SMP-30/gluconolactonase/LRE family protein [Arsenicitalea aurantiaca]|uniref:SMP-30/gluconolactonase/LRE family protein n=1 Tax=Arsenicitalea aurantiaca TaxID=1783274 RepID=A0A433XF98_9HYPH|nr:SMP-30/gluconolactonase/LRE family protein [Arsenicitalea aurantiaca]RUT32742.1 SMP-30/gluconolactonase/LRE family protein [Arsenicitalea aurantiaca]
MNQKAELFVDSRCELGEGPFWHTGLNRLFWFDILNQTLLSADASGRVIDRFTFRQPVTAAAVIDDDHLAIASAGALLRFTVSTDTYSEIVPIEADNPGNRTNDSRVHPSGGFWIGTMSRRGDEEPHAGAVYLYRDGALETLFDRITIPNSICFSPDGSIAYFADTPSGMIRQCAVDPASGRITGEWRDFASTKGHRGMPDGAVVDAEGYLWSARWGGSCVVRHAPDGSVDRVIEVPTSHVTCPAFGGEDMKTLYITTAREHMEPEQLAEEPHAGSVFQIRVDVPGTPEPRLAL